MTTREELYLARQAAREKVLADVAAERRAVAARAHAAVTGPEREPYRPSNFLPARAVIDAQVLALSRTQAAALDEIAAAHFALQDARYKKGDVPADELDVREDEYQAAVARREEAVRACIAAGISYADAAGRMGLTPPGALWLYRKVHPGWSATSDRRRRTASHEPFLDLGPEAVEALDYLQQQLGTDRSDVVTRALRVYAAVLHDDPEPPDAAA